MKLYFNTAIKVGVAVMGAVCLSAHALTVAKTVAGVQTKSSPSVVCSSFHLPSISAAFMDNQKLWWFVSSDGEKQDFKAQTLPILAATDALLWHNGSRIVTTLPDGAASGRFVIVRSTAIKKSTSLFGGDFGQYVEAIGVAQVEASPLLADGGHKKALKIVFSNTEVVRSDRLLPESCLSIALVNTKMPMQSELFSPANTDARPAKVVALLNGREYANDLNNVVIINQGRANGVSVGQKWSLVDGSNKEAANVTPYAQARVLQVFESMALVQVQKATHEVMVGSELYPERIENERIKVKMIGAKS